MIVTDSVRTGSSTTFTFSDGSSVKTEFVRPVRGDGYYERPECMTIDQKKAIERETLLIVV